MLMKYTLRKLNLMPTEITKIIFAVLMQGVGKWDEVNEDVLNSDIITQERYPHTVKFTENNEISTKIGEIANNVFYRYPPLKKM